MFLSSVSFTLPNDLTNLREWQTDGGNITKTILKSAVSLGISHEASITYGYRRSSRHETLHSFKKKLEFWQKEKKSKTSELIHISSWLVLKSFHKTQVWRPIFRSYN